VLAYSPYSRCKAKIPALPKKKGGGTRMVLPPSRTFSGKRLLFYARSM
jgi:hypothetical protein